MNEPKTEIVLNAVTLDRLVDGELSTAEYRRVLAALEQQPSAWRQCAEAFLQAQAWQRDFGELRGAAEVKPTEPIAEAPARTTSSNDWLRMLFVAAASFLFAFLLAQGVWRARQSPLVVGPSQPIVAAPQNEVPQNTPLVASEQPAGNQPLGSVQLAVNRSGSDEQTVVEVPVFDEAAAREKITTLRPALPDDLVDALKADGHRIDRQGQYISIPLDDGRQMMVPVESYRIVPVSRRSY